MITSLRRSQTWYGQPCNNNASVMDIPQDTITGYSCDVTIRFQRLKFTDGVLASLNMVNNLTEQTILSIVTSYFCYIFINT